eukprot:c22203_g3_i4 orf=23-598(+)
MALRVHVPIAAATGLWMQQQREAKPTSRHQPACKLSSGSNFDVKLARREVLSSFFFALAVPACQSSSLAAQPKDLHLSIAKIKDIIESDIRNGQYYVTGDLTQAIYEDDCRFVDPTTDIRGVDKYVAAVRLLFDPNSSHHELISIDLIGPSTIQAKWKLEGYLKFPWHPHIEPYEGTRVPPSPFQVQQSIR